MAPVRLVGVLGKDVEDQSLPVDDVDLEQLLQVSLLGRRQGVVENHCIDVLGSGEVGELARLCPSQ